MAVKKIMGQIAFKEFPFVPKRGGVFFLVNSDI